MGFEMTITAQKPALDVMMDGSMNVSVFSSQKKPKPPSNQPIRTKKEEKKKEKSSTQS